MARAFFALGAGLLYGLSILGAFTTTRLVLEPPPPSIPEALWRDQLLDPIQDLAQVPTSERSPRLARLRQVLELLQDPKTDPESRRALIQTLADPFLLRQEEAHCLEAFRLGRGSYSDQDLLRYQGLPDRWEFYPAQELRDPVAAMRYHRLAPPSWTRASAVRAWLGSFLLLAWLLALAKLLFPDQEADPSPSLRPWLVLLGFGVLEAWGHVSETTLPPLLLGERLLQVLVFAPATLLVFRRAFPDPAPEAPAATSTSDLRLWGASGLVLAALASVLAPAQPEAIWLFTAFGCTPMPILLRALAGVQTALYEEALFRGPFLFAVQESLGSTLALVPQALVWTLLHEPTLAHPLRAAFFFGVGLGLGRLSQRRGWKAPLVVHLAWNLGAILFSP